jgi:hypothetical protein
VLPQVPTAGLSEWFACDQYGALGVFEAGERALAPVAVGRDRAGHERAQQWIRSLRRKHQGVRAPNAFGSGGELLSLAERGLFVYAWRPASAAYELQARPLYPGYAGRLGLAPELVAWLETARLAGVDFSTTTVVAARPEWVSTIPAP